MGRNQLVGERSGAVARGAPSSSRPTRAARAITITGPTRELVEEARAIVRERSPEPDLSDAVQVAFWRWGDHGAHETTRALDTPSWPEIRPNYASACAGDSTSS